MKYYHALYLSDKFVSQKDTILEKIEQDKWQLDTYLIVLTKNETNHLELYNAVLLIQKILSKKDLFVVGIADGYDGALVLVQEILQEVYDETQGTDIRGYFLKKQQEYEEGNV